MWLLQSLKLCVCPLLVCSPGRETACAKVVSPERLGAFEEMEADTVSLSNVPWIRQGI